MEGNRSTALAVYVSTNVSTEAEQIRWYAVGILSNGGGFYPTTSYILASVPGSTEDSMNLFQVFNQNWLDRIGQVKAEDSGVEIQLGIQGTLLVLRFAETVLFAPEQDICHRHPLLA